MSIDHQTTIVAAWLAVIGSRSVRDGNPDETFRQLAERVPDLVPGELADAANTAKQIASEIRSLGHRVERQREFERRRAAPHAARISGQ